MQEREKKNEKQQQEKKRKMTNWGNHHIGVIGIWSGKGGRGWNRGKRRKELIERRGENRWKIEEQVMINSN